MEGAKFVYKGIEYPSRVTMRALRDFKRETGYDFLTQMQNLSSVDLGILLWASIRSQSRVEGIAFEASLDDFLDNVTPDEVAGWYKATNQIEDEDVSKKKMSKTSSLA